jgi:hypothetical protein
MTLLPASSILPERISKDTELFPYSIDLARGISSLLTMRKGDLVPSYWGRLLRIYFINRGAGWILAVCDSPIPVSTLSDALRKIAQGK